MHDILMITYKRPAFTRLSLARLLESCDPSMRVWVWHNGDHAETLDVVRSFEGHPRLYKLRVSPENVKLRAPTNWFWANSNGAYLSKVDDDCLMPDAWGERLRRVQDDEVALGMVGTWLFYEEDFVPELAARKLRTVGGSHQIMVHGFVQGSGYVMKRAVYLKLGPLRKRESFTGYCIRAAYRGWTNGWLYPFIHQDHMDDARSPHFPYRTETQFLENLSLSKKQFSVATLAEAKEFSQALARRLQTDVIDPSSYFGWRGFMRRLKRKFKISNGVENSVAVS